MIFRSIDSSGDWNWGQNLNSYFTGQTAIAANVQTRLLFFQNDFFGALNLGVDWWNLLGSTNPSAETGILLQTRQVIATSYGVTGINSIDVATEGPQRTITLTYDLSSIFTTSFQGSVQPES